MGLVVTWVAALEGVWGGTLLAGSGGARRVGGRELALCALGRRRKQGFCAGRKEEGELGRGKGGGREAG